MCVCVCVCVCVYMREEQLGKVRENLLVSFVCTYMYIYMCVYVCVCVCIYIYTYAKNSSAKFVTNSLSLLCIHICIYIRETKRLSRT
jgi:hypothetical protein